MEGQLHGAVTLAGLPQQREGVPERAVIRREGVWTKPGRGGAPAARRGREAGIRGLAPEIQPAVAPAGVDDDQARRRGRDSG